MFLPQYELSQRLPRVLVKGTVIDCAVREIIFFFQAVVVPGMGANLFSVTEALWKGVSTIFHPHKPRMEFKNIVLPMNLLATDEKTGKLLCSMKVQLGGGPGRRATRADVLLRMPGSGVDYNGDIQACDVCAVGKSKQKVHPKQPTYDVQHPFQLVTSDLMGSIKPPSIGGTATYQISSTNTPSESTHFSSRRNRKHLMLSSCTTRHL